MVGAALLQTSTLRCLHASRNAPFHVFFPLLPITALWLMRMKVTKDRDATCVPLKQQKAGGELGAVSEDLGLL